jgi:hypothetical protein
MFGRKKSTATVPAPAPVANPIGVDDARSKSPSAGNTNAFASPASHKGKGQRQRENTEREKRDPKTNSEANLLRSQIAATEYELQRLAKTMRKKVIVSPPPLTLSAHGTHGQTHPRIEKHHITSAEYSALQDQQSDLQRKLQTLRQRHVEVTGETYEQAKAKQKNSLTSRFRLTSRKNSGGGGEMDWNETGSQRESTSPVKTSVATAKKRVQARPAHWVTFTK